MSDRPRLRASGHVRPLAVLALLMGVAVMHIVVFAASHVMGPSGDHESTARAERMAGMVAEAVPTVTIADRGSAAASKHAGPCDSGGCGVMHSMHACEFILALAAALGLMVLAWVGMGASRLGPPGVGTMSARRARPPPWTMPSLAQLSILRI
ncbi:DUF6153 family protein [Nocardia terpenica]|uniref:Uncharacterized protein n=1 Tax=Nocardia terpenica TaxID=455432 RepID=A0A6G9ZCG1_9NOCA|nr:DUF6153 family protein [Nocardia terpenica]QIS22693.1 hypothetical protein F6W96_34460 [Nocardia terpenica]